MSLDRTSILLALLTVVVIVFGALIGGRVGLILALLTTLGLNIFAFWNADGRLLKRQGAEEVSAGTAPGLFRIVHELATRAAIAPPAIYVIRTAQPNALATGRDQKSAAIAVTSGLLNDLEERHIAGVVAHELAHIKNRDIVTKTVATTLVSALARAARFARMVPISTPAGVVVRGAALFAPLGAVLLQLAISRAREFEADRVGGQICGRPDHLAEALEILDVKAKLHALERAEADPASGQMYTVNPLKLGAVRRLFATHPDTDERIARLRRQARDMDIDAPGDDPYSAA